MTITLTTPGYEDLTVELSPIAAERIQRFADHTGLTLEHALTQVIEKGVIQKAS